jgi:hypothetical protein
MVITKKWDGEMIDEVIGIYDADGTIKGELIYVLKKYLKGFHCSLCDITHSKVSKKVSYNDEVEKFGIPVTMLHRNELSIELKRFHSQPLPLVLARSGSDFQILFSSEELEKFEGDDSLFFYTMRAKLNID